jgi:hypothetical protein
MYIYFLFFTVPLGFTLNPLGLGLFAKPAETARHIGAGEPNLDVPVERPLVNLEPHNGTIRAEHGRRAVERTTERSALG